MIETRPIPSAPGYQATSDGEIIGKKGFQLKGAFDQDGYRMVDVGTPAYRTRRVHMLILEAFVGPRPQGLVGRHKDGNKLNNRISNLEWSTVTANNRDTVKHGAHWQSSKTHCSNGHEFTPQNTRIRYRGSGIKRDCRACANGS